MSLDSKDLLTAAQLKDAAAVVSMLENFGSEIFGDDDEGLALEKSLESLSTGPDGASLAEAFLWWKWAAAQVAQHRLSAEIDHAFAMALHQFEKLGNQGQAHITALIDQFASALERRGKGAQAQAYRERLG